MQHDEFPLQPHVDYPGGADPHQREGVVRCGGSASKPYGAAITRWVESSPGCSGRRRPSWRTLNCVPGYATATLSWRCAGNWTARRAPRPGHGPGLRDAARSRQEHQPAAHRRRPPFRRRRHRGPPAPATRIAPPQPAGTRQARHGKHHPDRHRATAWLSDIAGHQGGPVTQPDPEPQQVDQQLGQVPGAGPADVRDTPGVGQHLQQRAVTLNQGAVAPHE
jgi:hypothetical protein